MDTTSANNRNVNRYIRIDTVQSCWSLCWRQQISILLCNYPHLVVDRSADVPMSSCLRIVCPNMPESNGYTPIFYDCILWVHCIHSWLWDLAASLGSWSIRCGYAYMFELLSLNAYICVCTNIYVNVCLNIYAYVNIYGSTFVRVVTVYALASGDCVCMFT